MLIVIVAGAFTTLSSDVYPDFPENAENISSTSFPVELDTVDKNSDSCDKYSNIFKNPIFVDTTHGDYHRLDASPGKKRYVAVGIGLLAAEYTIGPAIAYATWWNEGFVWDNPLKYIGEREPFLADNAWHVAGCMLFTELHYRIIQKCFGSRHAVVLSTSLTLFDFTIVECLDALEKTGKWEFSLGDMFANVFGVGFWTFKHYYPNAPVDIRVGIRKWDDAFDLFQQAFTAVTDFDKFQSRNWDHYSILKVEGIYRFNRGFYFGVALSKKDYPSEDNLWGITVGWDIIKGLKKTGHRDSFLATISEYISLPISFTYWLD